MNDYDGMCETLIYIQYYERFIGHYDQELIVSTGDFMTKWMNEYRTVIVVEKEGKTIASSSDKSLKSIRDRIKMSNKMRVGRREASQRGEKVYSSRGGKRS